MSCSVQFERTHLDMDDLVEKSSNEDVEVVPRSQGSSSPFRVDTLTGSSLSSIPSSITVVNRSGPGQCPGTPTATPPPSCHTPTTTATVTVPTEAIPSSSNVLADANPSISFQMALEALGRGLSTAQGSSALSPNSDQGEKDKRSSRKTVKSCNRRAHITPVPNIKPIISITPVLSSPANNSKPTASSVNDEKGWDLSSSGILHSVAAMAFSHHRVLSGQQKEMFQPIMSHSPGLCQLAPIALTTKCASTTSSSSSPAPLNLVTNGETLEETHHLSAEERATSSDNDSKPGGNSVTSISSDVSNPSSDNECTNRRENLRLQETKRLKITEEWNSLKESAEKYRFADDSVSLENTRNNFSLTSNIGGLTIDVPSSITVTAVGASSPPLSSPLNLSMKRPPTDMDDSLYSSSLLPASTSVPLALNRGGKRGPKPKHLRGLSALTAEENQLRQRQASLEELKAQLETQLKQQQMQLKLAHKAALLSQTSLPLGHMQHLGGHEKHTSVSCLPSGPFDVTLTPSIAALSKGLSARSVSLLTSNGSSDPTSTSVHSKSSAHGQSSKLPSIRNGTISVIPVHFSKSLKASEKKLDVKTRSSDIETSGDETSDYDDSSCDSDSNSGSDTSEDSETSGSDSDRSQDTEASSGKGQKRGYSSEGSSPAKKFKRNIIADERELRIPLEHGWRRLTKIRMYSYSGARGEVIYFAPCGKKLKTYPEVVRYLEKNGINDIGRENFSFSAKHNVGEFLEPQGNGEYLEINEPEVIARIEEFRARKSRRYVPVAMRRQRDDKKQHRREEEKLKRRLEEEDAVLEMKRKVKARNCVKDKAVFSIKDTRMLKAAEVRRQKEHIKFLRQQEKVEKQEQLRIERETRAHQILEARKKRQELLEKQRLEETVRRDKEREMKRLQAIALREQELQKRREMLIMVDLERERRRQHMLLVKALETRKKQEERERMREERLEEKRIIRERKFEQRRLELHLIREMKKPVEDMELKDAEPLPTLNRIPGVKLSGPAFADVLMVFEFLHNFGETLGFDMDSLPTLNTLQLGLLNDNSCEEEVISVLHHLLTCAIEDPGIPGGSKGKTTLNQHLKEVDITPGTVSEVLRIFMRATEGVDCKYLKWLNDRPFVALNPTQKASILAHMCNELLCSRVVCRQVDTMIDLVNNMRRDKWMVEGKVRKLRMVHARKIAREQLKEDCGFRNGEHGSVVNKGPSNDNLEKKTKVEIDDEAHHHSDSEESHGNGEVEDVDDEPDVSIEDLGKKIEKMTKQHNQFRRKLIKSSQQLRAVNLGQDRYKRRYWMLPFAGGIFVESSELPDDQFVEVSDAQTVDVKTESCEKVEKSAKDEKISTEEETCLSDTVEAKETTMDLKRDNETSSQSKEDIVEIKEEVNVESNSQETAALSANIDVTPKTNDEMQKQIPNENVCKSVDKEASSTQSSQELSERDKSVFECDAFPPIGLIPKLMFNGPSNLQCKEPITDTVFNLPVNCVDRIRESQHGSLSGNPYFSAVFSVPQFQISAEQFLKTFEERSREKHWFSIVPRMPCDEMSITRLQPSTKPPPNVQLCNETLTPTELCSASRNATNQVPVSLASSSSKSILNSSSNACSLPKYPPIQFSPYYFHNSVYAALQMNYINGTTSPVLHPQVLDMHSGETKVSGQNSVSRFVCNGPLPSADEIPPSLWSPSIKQQFEALQELQKKQYAEPQPIPLEFRRGWWRITDSNQLKVTVKSLHARGIREKTLQLKLQKYMDVACEACSRGHQALDLQITDLDREIAHNVGGAPNQDKDSDWNRDAVRRLEVAVLEQVENLEEKVANASMQLKQWKLPSKITEDESVKFNVSCDSVFQSDDGNCAEDSKSKASKMCALFIAKERLLNLEAAIERRYMKPPLGNGTSDVTLSTVTSGGSSHHYHHSNGNTNNDGISSNATTPADEAPPSPFFEDVSKGLLLWRTAVQNAKTSSQLAVCLNYLEANVAWDRSIMKASCQFCNSGDNEAMLLLCDGCDKGYHTYCFKPKMESIPEGDWFCYECLNKATGDRLCLFCGKKGKNICVCDNCPKAYHTDCLDPPLTRVPKTKWLCPHCNSKMPKANKGKSRKSKETKEVISDMEDSPKKVERSSAKGERNRERNKVNNSGSSNNNKDLGPCREILSALQSHQDAWPFLLPVNTKQFPSYRKVIRRPMDLSTINNKLESNLYRTRGDFVTDARLMFDNCETFNEDDSPVGKAGHNLRAFFENMWSDIADK